MLGQVIHGYRVDRALSVDKGGMGDVFFATHVESGAEAVVKVLKPEMSAHRDIVTRFFNEARAAASIHHPGIVSIHNVGYHGDRAYLLMEKLRGDDLETRLQQGPLPLDRAIVFMRQAAGAIAAAHERGIVHRDLKPANLFIVRDPDVMGGERVKVLDFGIAKLSLDAGGNKTQGVFGTPAYMSPEQCASAGEVDARSDLYALGCIFYELVCGRPPFGHGGIELIASHLRDAPPPPRALAPWVPPAVEAVIMQLLEKNPALRFASCAALIGALDGVAATLPPGATPSLPPQANVATPTTLSGAAGAVGSMPSVPPTMPAARSNRGLMFGLLAVAVAGAAIAVAVVMSGGGGNQTTAAAAGSSAPTPTPTPTTPTPVVPTATAEELYQEGLALDQTGRHAAAVKKFRTAYDLDPQNRYATALAIAHMKLDNCAEAVRVLDQVLAGPADEAKKVKIRELRARCDGRATSPAPAPAPVPKPKPEPASKPEPTPKPKPEPTPKPEPKPEPTTGPLPTPPPPTPVREEPRQPDPPPATPPMPMPSVAARNANTLNMDGKALMMDRRYAEAAEKFREAYALDAQPKYLVNLAISFIQQGKCGDAEKTLARILAGRADEALKDKARQLQGKCGS